MTKIIITICVALVLILSMTLVISGFNSKKESEQVQDIESFRADLRERVDSGKLTREEAIVKLAEAQANLGSHEKDKEKFSPELEALGKELEEQVVSGQMTEDEAKAAWIEVAKKGKDSIKETE